MSTFCFSVHLLLDMWIVPLFWLLWIMLHWTWLYKCLFESLFFILSSIYLGVKLLQLVKNPPAMQETPVRLIEKIRWKRDRLPTPVFLGFPVAQLVKNPPAMQETWVQSLGWEDPLEKGWLPTPVFWPGEFHGLAKSWTQLSDFYFHFQVKHRIILQRNHHGAFHGGWTTLHSYKQLRKVLISLLPH